ncbi:helix-turn-helix transcriptional regulator [uncultured Roseobacter sp.]|uniref:helix-turn-helix transcriptional regulator n=1 Tax=uncultured Roseobacter sp. TaxID=114847 RepID=UPI00261BF850|nr:helix-turn-helix transcriptional regulator [uncultured Roseobacter sp.]
MHNKHMNNLAAFRDLRGLNQQELAELIGVNQSTIQRAEAEHPSAKLITYKKCAAALGITLDQVFGPARSEIQQRLHDALDLVPDEHHDDVRAILNLVKAGLDEEAE